MSEKERKKGASERGTRKEKPSSAGEEALSEIRTPVNIARPPGEMFSGGLAVSSVGVFVPQYMEETFFR